MCALEHDRDAKRLQLVQQRIAVGFALGVEFVDGRVELALTPGSMSTALDVANLLGRHDLGE